MDLLFTSNDEEKVTDWGITNVTSEAPLVKNSRHPGRWNSLTGEENRASKPEILKMVKEITQLVHDTMTVKD